MDGTPLSPIANSMYQPGGAMPGESGVQTGQRSPAGGIGVSGTKRWSMSKLWVTEPRRSRLKDSMSTAPGLMCSTWNTEP